MQKQIVPQVWEAEQWVQNRGEEGDPEKNISEVAGVELDNIDAKENSTSIMRWWRQKGARPTDGGEKIAGAAPMSHDAFHSEVVELVDYLHHRLGRHGYYLLVAISRADTETKPEGAPIACMGGGNISREQLQDIGQALCAGLFNSRAVRHHGGN